MSWVTNCFAISILMFVPVTPDEGKGVEYIVMFQISHSSCHPIDKENHETWSTRIQSRNRGENGRPRSWLPPPVALGKVPSYPVEYRLDKSTRTGEPVILSEHQIASGRDVPLAGGHVMVSIQDRSQDRGAIKHQWGGSLRAQSSHGHSFHTEISSQTGVALVSCKGV